MRNTRRVFEQKGYTTVTPPANVVDRSRFGNNGVLSGGAAYKKVRDLYVLDFTSATAKATIAKNASIDNLSQFTFRAWVYYAGAGGNNVGRIFDKHSISLLYINAANNRLIYNRSFSTATGAWATPTSGFLVGWHCVQITYDKGDVANNPVILIDGVSVTVTRTTAPTGTSLSDSAGDLILGNISAGDRFLNGYLAEVEILSGIATVAEGKRWYNSTCGMFGLPQIA